MCKMHQIDTQKTEAFAEQLIRDSEGVRRPWFVAVYGALPTGTPYKFYEVARRLPTDSRTGYQMRLNLRDGIQGKPTTMRRDVPPK